LSADELSVELTYTPGSLDNGSPVTNYKIYVREDDSTTFTEITADCAEYSVTLAGTTCTVLMTTLKASPYNLDYNDDVIFKVISVNLQGDSVFSNESPVGAKVQDVPDQMATPVYVSKTSTSLTVSYTELTFPTETGGAPITQYLLEYRMSNDTGAWSSIIATTPAGEVISSL